MGEGGLRRSRDPARAFLAEHDGPAPGSVVAPTLEGIRPLLVEVQALVRRDGLAGRPAGRRAASTRTGWPCSSPSSAGGPGSASGSHDVYANLAGGLSVDEPALDLPLAIALASSLRDRPVHAGTVAIGEVGLLGELRAVTGARAPAARGRPARLHPGDRARARAAARRPRGSDASTGSRSSPSGRLREAIEARSTESGRSGDDRVRAAMLG